MEVRARGKAGAGVWEKPQQQGARSPGGSACQERAQPLAPRVLCMGSSNEAMLTQSFGALPWHCPSHLLPPRGWTVAGCHPMALEQCYKRWWHAAGAWMGCREKNQHAFPSTLAAHALEAPNIVAAESFGELPLHRAPTYPQLELC